MRQTVVVVVVVAARPRGVWFPLPPRLVTAAIGGLPWASSEMMGRMMERRAEERACLRAAARRQKRDTPTLEPRGRITRAALRVCTYAREVAAALGDEVRARALARLSLCLSVCLAEQRASRRVARTHRARTVRRNRTARRRTRSTRRTRARTPVGGHLDRVGSLCVFAACGVDREPTACPSPRKFREECVGTGTRRRVLVETDSSRR